MSDITIPMIVHFFAVSAYLCASSYLPAFHAGSTLVAFTMPTMPSGKQQNNVERIE